MKIQSFTEWVNEMSIVVLGDRKTIMKSSNIGKLGISKYWKKLDSFKYKKYDIEIYKSKSHKYILGVWGLTNDDKEVFIIITEVSPIKRNDLKQLGYKKAIQMKSLETSEDFRDQGFAKLLYKWFISNGYSIVADMVQFDGTRRLYASLSEHKDIKADIVDVTEHKEIESDTIISQDKFEDWDFDERVWSYDYDKQHIRIVLTRK